MSYEEFQEKVVNSDENDCSCHIRPSCYFCVEGLTERYEEYCKEEGIKPVY